MKKLYKKLCSAFAKKPTEQVKGKPIGGGPIVFANSNLMERLQVLTIQYLDHPFFEKCQDLDTDWVVMKAYDVFHEKGDFSPPTHECLREIKKATLRDIENLIDSDPSSYEADN